MANAELVRSLYGDISPDDEGDYLFSDGTIEGWLELTDDNPYRCAAMACRALAADQNYLLKNIRTDDLTINGSAVATEFRQLADDLDKQADDFDRQKIGGFEVVDLGNPFPVPTRPEATAWPYGGGFCA